MVSTQRQLGRKEADIVYQKVVTRVALGKVVDADAGLLVVVGTHHREADLLPTLAGGNLARIEHAHIVPLGVAGVASLHIESENGRVGGFGGVGGAGVVNPRIAIELLTGTDRGVGGDGGHKPRILLAVHIEAVAVGSTPVLLADSPTDIDPIDERILAVEHKIVANRLAVRRLRGTIGVEKSVGALLPRQVGAIEGDIGGAGLGAEIEVLLLEHQIVVVDVVVGDKRRGRRTVGGRRYEFHLESSHNQVLPRLVLGSGDTQLVGVGA